MQLVSSRMVSFIDFASLAICEAKEALFHDESKGFILYLSGGDQWSASEVINSWNCARRWCG